MTTLLLGYNRLDHLTGLEMLSALETLDIQVGRKVCSQPDDVWRVKITLGPSKQVVD